MAEVRLLKLASGKITAHSTGTDDAQFRSLGVGVAAPGVSGELTAQSTLRTNGEFNMSGTTVFVGATRRVGISLIPNVDASVSLGDSTTPRAWANLALSNQLVFGVAGSPGDIFHERVSAGPSWHSYTHDPAAGATKGHRFVTAVVSTADATVTTLKSITLSDSTTYWFEAHVIVRDTADVERGHFWRTVRAHRAGAGAVVGTVNTVVPDDETSAGLDVTFDASGNDVRLRVTGLGATNLRWSATITHQLAT